MTEPGEHRDVASDVLTRVIELLERFHVLTLACRDVRGSWAAPVFFANDGLDLYFMSSPGSRHARSLAFDRRLAGAIHGPTDDWRSIVGLQVSGDVHGLAPDDLSVARMHYARRFPFVEQAAAASDAGLANALQKAAWYCLSVDEAVIVDNTKGLGQRTHWSRSSG